MHSKDITENSWSKLFSILRTFPHLHLKNEELIKRFFDGVCWIWRSGTRWRNMPKEYGHWNSIYKRFCRWAKKGIWEHIFQGLIDQPDLEYVMIDATIVKAHMAAAGYGNQQEQALGKSRGGFTTKIHVILDALGYPLKFIVTPGNMSDIKCAQALTSKLFDTNIVADKGYDSDQFREYLQSKNCESTIPYRSNRKEQKAYDKGLYKERNIIERFFARIKQFRKIATRYDKTMTNFMAGLHVIGTLIWLR